jgi:triacylglycerol lipase
MRELMKYLLLSWLLALLPLVMAGAPVRAMPAQYVVQPQECVILLHGLWRTSLSMKPVEWHLERAGYTVVNVDYPSLLVSIEESSRRAIKQGMLECEAQQPERISMVAHSLGGILVRAYLGSHQIETLNRVVMLGTPNQGSELADYFASRPWLSLLLPEAVLELGTGPASVPLRLGPVDFQLGVIAGTASWRSRLPGFPVGTSDGTVAVAEARVAGMADFIELPVTHTRMLWSGQVLDQTVHFLRSGRFLHE